MSQWFLALVARIAFATAALASLPVLAGPACFDEAARRYHVPVELLKAISMVESRGDPNARNYNTNGSYDIGHMQINSWWLKTLEQYGITEETLLEPCVNTNIGAWVLAQNIARYGLTWNAVGAYNAASDSKRLVYARKVATTLRSQQMKSVKTAKQTQG